MNVEMEEEEEEIITRRPAKKSGFLSDDEADDLEDDNVIWEREVVVCNSIPNTEMFCVAYPASKNDAWDKQKLPMARYKRNVRLLEMRLLPDTETGSFDKKKAELMYESGTTPQKTVDIQSLRKNDEVYEGRAFSNDHPIINSIGFMKHGQFYICPLAGNIEMHRSIHGLNKKKKSTGKGGKNDENDETMSTEDEDEQAANTSTGNIRVKFSRPETERQKKRREASALHRERRIAEDVWIPMNVHLKDDEKVQEKMEKMSRTGIKSEEHREPTAIEIRDLVNRAIICSIKEELVIESGKEHMLSKQRIDELEPIMQIKAHVVKSHVIRTGEMIKLLKNFNIPFHDIIHNLQQCARLVNGVWVLQSDLLFNNLPPAHSNVAGKTDVYRSELWRNARDLALCLIDAGHSVTRLTLITCFNLNQKDAEDILSSFGYKDETDRTWKLRIERDQEFLDDPCAQRYIVEEKKKWVEKFEGLQKIIGNAKKHRGSSPNKKK